MNTGRRRITVKKYETAEMEVITFSAEDVIVTSSEVPCENETPIG